LRGGKPGEGAGRSGDNSAPPASLASAPTKSKFQLQGLEQTDKLVTATSTCGRVYLPLSWVGKRVKIIRLD
jgi:hypothetical protein